VTIDPTLVRSLAGASVAVAGDVMLDQYLWGEVVRLNPEAPVPLVTLERRSAAPGGAANVARGITALGGSAWVAGVVGDDVEGDQVRALVTAAGVAADGLVVIRGRRTSVKVRVIARGQQVVRVDHEDSDDVGPQVGEGIAACVRSQLGTAKALVVSDYAKGVVSPPTCRTIIDAARAAGVPSIVDPKGRDYTKYAGATVVAPNLNEAAEAVGADPSATDARTLAARLAEALPGTHVVVTRGPAGMLFRSAGGALIEVGVAAHDVRDVTGAGDTVVATLAAALGQGADLEDAVRLANYAASRAVTRVGATAVGLEELAGGI
jgi:D-beta-D-heptose 7-phosphate kinase/D-beta-D-heptose 1-phosphate adenosyltransferase